MAYLFQINPEHGLCEYVEECQSYSQEVDVGGPGKNHRNKSYSAKHRGSLNVYVQGGRFFFFLSINIQMCVNRAHRQRIVLNLVFLKQKLHLISELRQIVFLFLVTSLLSLSACVESWEILLSPRQFVSISEEEEELRLASHQILMFRKQRNAPLCYSSTYTRAFAKCLTNGDF